MAQALDAPPTVQALCCSTQTITCLVDAHTSKRKDDCGGVGWHAFCVELQRELQQDVTCSGVTSRGEAMSVDVSEFSVSDIVYRRTGSNALHPPALTRPRTDQTSENPQAPLNNFGVKLV